jgi:hypothetical protein
VTTGDHPYVASPATVNTDRSRGYCSTSPAPCLWAFRITLAQYLWGIPMVRALLPCCLYIIDLQLERSIVGQPREPSEGVSACSSAEQASRRSSWELPTALARRRLRPWDAYPPECFAEFLDFGILVVLIVRRAEGVAGFRRHDAIDIYGDTHKTPVSSCTAQS